MAALYDSVTEYPHVSYYYRFLLTLQSVQLEHNGQCIGNYRCTFWSIIRDFFEHLRIIGQKLA